MFEDSRFGEYIGKRKIIQRKRENYSQHVRTSTVHAHLVTAYDYLKAIANMKVKMEALKNIAT